MEKTTHVSTVEEQPNGFLTVLFTKTLVKRKFRLGNGFFVAIEMAIAAAEGLNVFSAHSGLREFKLPSNEFVFSYLL